MKQTLALLLSTLLVGCMADMPVKRSGTERAVVFTRACDDRGAALDMAEQHCQQYGRHARTSQVYECIMSFDCVE